MDMNEVDLGALGLRTTGRAQKPLEAFVARELTEADLASLQTERGTSAPVLKNLRAKHHRLARLLAEGVSESVAATACGYVASRVSILKNDPAFRELMAFYSEKVDTAYYDMHEAMSMVGKDAVEEIAERLEDDPSEFTVPQLLDIAKTFADRTGHGPSQKTELDIRVGLADRLELARQRAIEGRAIDITQEDSK